MSVLTPQEAMALAIEEGKKGAGFVSPNPLVGCVILDSRGQLLASGFHAQLGGNHAEAAAVKKISGNANLAGAQVFVTLEPCAHHGRTPPCAEMLAKLPIASVTYGLEDPNSQVSGKGAQILRDAGKKVELFPELKIELEELAEIFLVNQRLRRPFVAVKTAASLDGKIALEDGSSQWITGPEARESGSELRGHYDAVLTGAGTVVKDNPRMNSRAEMFANKPQKLVILDPQGQTVDQLAHLNVAKARASDDIFVVVKPGLNKKPATARLLEVKMDDGGFDLKALLQTLQDSGIHSLFVEAGGFTTGKFLQSGLMDRLYLYLAPKILGEGASWTSGLKTASLDKALTLHNWRHQTIGGDLFITARTTPSSR
jgi:diaminohydroxyphosphoribosylaminopyrimidine deaminase/5-amino-6-(5-phosphoribosylamino)uracil reductase